jgi:hypothetical protein
MHKIKHIIPYVYYILYINSLLERGLPHIRIQEYYYYTLNLKNNYVPIARKFTDGEKCFIISIKSSAKPGKIQFLSVKAHFFSSNRKIRFQRLNTLDTYDDSSVYGAIQE